MDLLPIFLAILAGLVPVAALLPGTHSTNPEAPRRFGFLPGAPALLLLWVSLAFPLGSGVIGLAYFVLLLTGVDSPWVVYAVVACFSACASWVLSRGPKAEIAPADPLAQPDAGPAFPLNWLLGILAAVCMLAVLASMAGILAKSPHGAWDSWAIWSLRGKFFAAGDGFWRNAVDPGFHLSHPEYPVMFSSFLGWSWRLAGVENAAVPQAVAYAFLLSLTGIVGAGIGLLRRASLAWMSIPVLLSPIVMMTVPASLYADLPMGTLSAAAAMALLLGIASSLDPRCFALAGIFASLCAWMKEEVAAPCRVGRGSAGVCMARKAKGSAMVASVAALRHAPRPRVCFCVVPLRVRAGCKPFRQRGPDRAPPAVASPGASSISAATAKLPIRSGECLPPSGVCSRTLLYSWLRCCSCWGSTAGGRRVSCSLPRARRLLCSGRDTWRHSCS